MNFWNLLLKEAVVADSTRKFKKALDKLMTQIHKWVLKGLGKEMPSNIPNITVPGAGSLREEQTTKSG